jgi:hypothetical protein
VCCVLHNMGSFASDNCTLFVACSCQYRYR